MSPGGPGSHRDWMRQGRVLPDSLRRAQPCQHLTSHSWPPELRSHFCGPKLLSLWLCRLLQQRETGNQQYYVIYT